MKATSTVHYTLEDREGCAETFNDIYIFKDDFIGSTTVNLNGEGESITVPLIKGYKQPYDFDITDEIGTEHYIYYEELDN